ncbi:CCR4-NOT transcription complex subunit 11 isoform X2 [Carica papaya]|uniref:CCR4-NOT transcription complex subunit 11 isoform X2 n=1 Tax=Carica papaya TaxID=3649 RepID=UPI000B8CA035|nr:CCR4-NOT transcription complex subunit 11 isoform X2 [Carica papaya]
MMNKEETEKIVSLLKSEQRPIEEIFAEFNSRFPRLRHFVICFSLCQILQDRKALRPTERLIGFAILHQCYSSQKPSANPFISFIVASDEQSEKYERAFILQFLGSSGANSNKELLKTTAVDYIKSFDPSSHAFPQREQLQQQYFDKVNKEPYSCLFEDVSVKNVLADPDVPHGCDSNSAEFDLEPGAKPKLGSGDRDETLSQSLANLSLNGLGPQWIRPFPPRYPVRDSELVWLNPDNNHELVWDHGMCADTSRGAAVRDLIAKALKGALAPAQQEGRDY